MSVVEAVLVIVGLLIGILLVEVIFANNQSWPDVVPVVFAIVGGLIGSKGARRIRIRA